MKRFWKRALAVADEGGQWRIELDGRPVRTPVRALLLLPGEPLAAAVADEWDSAGETVDPRAMPLTGLANAAIDRVMPDPPAFARGLAAYGESDLLCYRAEGPEALIEREEQHWDPLLAWARHRFDIDFEITSGILHRPQPKRTTEQLARAVAAKDGFVLAALSPLVTISGSLVIALALVGWVYVYVSATTLSILLSLGWIVAGVVACYRGLNSAAGPKGVGDAVNQSVVITFLLLFFVNFVITTLYLQLVPGKGA